MKNRNVAALAVAAGAALAAGAAGLATWWAKVDPRRYRLDRGHAWVYGTKLPDGSWARVVDVDGTWQGACLDDPLAAPPLAYLRRFDTVLARDPKRILVLGGGACSWPRHAAALYPDCLVDVVEKDAGMAYLATKEFGLDRYPNLELHVCDALEFLGRAEPGSYDAVVSDVFAGTDPVRSLETPEALARVRDVLAPEGMYLQNVVCERGDTKRLDEVVEALQDGLGLVHLMPALDEDISAHDNYVVCVSRARLDEQDGEEG